MTGHPRNRGLGAVARAAVGLIWITPFAVPCAVEGQTPVTAVGLGYQVEAVDARASALASLGGGLLGGSFSIRHPADLVLHGDPSFSMTYATEAVDFTGPDANWQTGRTRFPAIRALFPFGDWGLGIGFGGELDQSWNASVRDSVELGGVQRPYEDTRENDGGLSHIDLSVARSLGPVGIGVSAQRMTGSLRQLFVRSFDAHSEEAGLNGVAGARSYSYSGWRVGVGGLVQIGDWALASVSLSPGSTVDSYIQEGEGDETQFGLPALLSAGVSARFGQLMLTGSWSRRKWQDAALPADVEFSAHETTWLGGGAELDAFSLLGGRVPLRLGYRVADLPFSTTGEVTQERAMTLGFGWIFREGLAAADVSAETGSRTLDSSGSGSSEGFSRITVTFSLRQRLR